MRRKIEVNLLEIGMYVAALDRPWLGTPFLFQGFEIQNSEDIDKLKQYCKWVYIGEDEEDKSNPPGKRPAANISAPKFTIEAAPDSKNLHLETLRYLDQPQGQSRSIYPDQTTLEEEIQEVKEHHEKMKSLIYTFMDDARLGKPIDGVGAKKTVQAMVESVVRNPDALTCFTQLKKRNEYTALHSLRVCILALNFGRHLGFSPEELQVLGIGALLHDIGKMKVPNEILDKPDRLTKSEYAIMRNHVPYGVEILEHAHGVPAAAIHVARCHHERYDGGGYSSGLKGNEINIFGMIGSIVDCYDAITSDRSYHAGIPSHVALKKMYQWRNREFHPGMVEQFIQCLGIYPIGSVVELNTGEVGVVVTTNRTHRLNPRVAIVLKPDHTPYPTPSITDLSQTKTPDGQSYTILHALEPGSYGVNPEEYLPVNRLILPDAPKILVSY